MADDWTMTSATDAAPGQAFYVRFVTFARPEDGGSALTITFGGVWRLMLYATGQAELDSRANGSWEQQAQFRWMAAPRFERADHWLWIYETGARLVVRNMELGKGGATLGVTVYDATAPVTPGDPSQTPHALRSGPWSFAGGQPMVLGCTPQAFTAGTVTLSQPECASVGLAGEGSTQQVVVHVWGTATDGQIVPQVQAFNDSGDPWPPAGSADTPSLGLGLRWQVSWDNPVWSTFLLAGLDLTLPPTAVNDGSVGTNLLALDGVADRRVSLAREGDLTHERLDATFLASGAALAAYIRPNMSLRYVVGGLTCFRGLTDDAEWAVMADAAPPLGTLTLSAAGLWKRFTKAVWPGGPPFDGRKLTDCLADVAAAAGLPPAACSIVDDPYTLPPTPDGEAPSWVFRPGTRLDRILSRLRESFFGTWLTCYFRLTDGLFVVDYTTPASVAASFYQTTALAAAAGVPQQVILADSYAETLDERGMANLVIVTGQAPDGSPLTARAVDWSSIRDSTSANYVGEVWPELHVDAALTSQGAVNAVCRSLFDRLRRPRVLAQWRSVRVDLWPGQVVSLLGPSYGGSYVLRAMQLEQSANGVAAGALGLAVYRAEKLT